MYQDVSSTKVTIDDQTVEIETLRQDINTDAGRLYVNGRPVRMFTGNDQIGYTYSKIDDLGSTVLGVEPTSGRAVGRLMMSVSIVTGRTWKDWVNTGEMICK